MTIRDIQQSAQELCERKGWKDRNPAQRFRYLISEVGELSTELIRLEWDTDDHEEAKRNIGHEMYDIVWNLCDLANQLDIDLEKAFKEKEAVSRNRVWTGPAADQEQHESDE